MFVIQFKQLGLKMVSIIYGETIIPETFRARLNGRLLDIFNPVPGTMETVIIDLEPGRNRLFAAVEGVRDNGTTATDWDLFWFRVN